MTEIKWMEYIEFQNQNKLVRGLVNPGQTVHRADNYIPLSCLERLGAISKERPIPPKSKGRLFDFEPKPREEIEAYARQIGATIIAEPNGSLARKRGIQRDSYYFFKEKP
jgi:hypothetical protein